MKNVELLAPAGGINQLYSGLHFGADAVYVAGKDFGLRAFADNFDEESLLLACRTVHGLGKKLYAAVNIFPKSEDFCKLGKHLELLQNARADAVIVSDIGVLNFIKKNFPSLDIHISTQANTNNKFAAEMWRDLGAKRVVLARELNLEQIAEIHGHLGQTLELEAFIHGAMCVSYSGRCLLSNYLSGRDANRGECVQACRWEYVLHEKGRDQKPLEIAQDKHGSYILNSRDLNTIEILDKIIDAGVTSLKIEGRNKSEYYVGCTVNAYRRRLDDIAQKKPFDPALLEELDKTGHREFTRGFYTETGALVSLDSSKNSATTLFVALVLGYDEERKAVVVEMRNRFKEGDILEIVSKGKHTELKVDRVYNEDGQRVPDCKIVQQRLYIESTIRLEKYDMLRKVTGGEDAE